MSNHSINDSLQKSSDKLVELKLKVLKPLTDNNFDMSKPSVKDGLGKIQLKSKPSLLNISDMSIGQMEQIVSRNKVQSKEEEDKVNPLYKREEQSKRDRFFENSFTKISSSPQRNIPLVPSFQR